MASQAVNMVALYNVVVRQKLAGLLTSAGGGQFQEKIHWNREYTTWIADKQCNRVQQ